MSDVKPNAKDFTIKEQRLYLDTKAGEIVIQCELKPDGVPHMIAFGDALPFGNRDIFFNKDGVCDGGGTALEGCHKPAWRGPIEESKDDSTNG